MNNEINRRINHEIKNISNMLNYQGYVKYPLDPNLDIRPTEGESQFESYQSIIAKIMSADTRQPVHPDDMSPYEILCAQYGIKLSTRKCNNCILFKEEIETHYIAIRNNKKYDPYQYYQAGWTQGFCQMYAFFLYIGDTEGFLKLESEVTPYDMDFSFLVQNKYQEFVKLVVNNYVCLHKIINILKKNYEVRNRFEREYDLIRNDNRSRRKYGIKKAMTLDKFIENLESLTLNSIVYYIYDLFREQWIEE